MHGPKRHLIARVNITADGAIIPLGLPMDAHEDLKGPRHGLSWDHNPKKDIALIRATCPKSSCDYDASCDYEWLRDELARATAESATEPAEYELKR